MSHLRALLADRKRSQRGSVLSGVLIMTAFVAILSGALLTALSTNFLLSHRLVTRVADEATVSSAVELSMSRLQATQLNSPCPSLAPLTLNNLTAVPAYSGCFPTVDVRSPQFTQLPSSAAFRVDGTHAQLGALNDYVVGNAGGTVLDYTFGSTTPRWTLALGGAVTGQPLVLNDPNNGGHYLDALPLSGGACSPSPYCLNVRSDDGSATPPPFLCSIGLNTPVVTQPAASPTNGGLGYYGYGSILEATDLSTGGHLCDWEANATIPGGQPITAGPLAFRCTNGCGNQSDEVYAVVSDSSSSTLYWYRYRSGSLNQMGSLALPWGKAAGLDVSAATLPASVAITFHEGGVALVHLAASGAMSLAGSTALSNVDIQGAPNWCVQCGNTIGVGGSDGILYLFDSSLSLRWTFDTGGSAITTTPNADGAANWYVATDDGYLHELQLQGSTLTRVKRYGPMAQFGSSVQIGTCPAGICLYLGAVNSNGYLVQLDARDAVIWACLSTAPPACSGINPRVWAQVEIGVAGNTQVVHVQGWSYYSP